VFASEQGSHNVTIKLFINIKLVSQIFREKERCEMKQTVKTKLYTTPHSEFDDNTQKK